jgi:hypothetical protein
MVHAAARDVRAIFPDAGEVVPEAEPELPLRNH